MKCNNCGADMRYTGDIYQCEYCGNIRHRQDEAENESWMKMIYHEALQKMEDASDSEEYMEAADLFRGIPYYEDSMLLAQRCIHAAGEARQEACYIKALQLLSQNSESAVTRAMDMLLQIPDYRDSNGCLVYAHKKLERIRERSFQALLNRMRGNGSVSSLFFTGSSLLLLLGVLLPWYQRVGTYEILGWKVDMVTDSMGLLHGIHEVFPVFGILWYLLFVGCMAVFAVTFGKSEKKVSVICLVVLLILAGAVWGADAPDGYVKAGFGRFFTAAGFTGYLLTLKK